MRIRRVVPPRRIQHSVRGRRTTRLRQQTAILGTRNRRRTTVGQTRTAIQSVRVLSRTLRRRTSTPDVLRFLVTRSCIRTGRGLKRDGGSGIMFVSPGLLARKLTHLVRPSISPAHSDRSGRTSSFPDHHRQSSWPSCPYGFEPPVLQLIQFLIESKSKRPKKAYWGPLYSQTGVSQY